MSRILLAWELGGGFGHRAPFLSLAPRHAGPSVGTMTDRAVARIEALATKGAGPGS